jgi:hypothetical protein
MGLYSRDFTIRFVGLRQTTDPAELVGLKKSEHQ